MTPDADPQPTPDEQPAPLPEVKPYNFLHEQAAQHNEQVKSVEEYIEDLRSNARYRPWFEQFHPDSWVAFIQHYALAKERALRYGENSARWLQERVTEYTDAAYERLWDIQQKKLFDLQCRWRAEQVVLPKVKVCADFDKWSQRIHRCPFLEPITPDEFDMYCQFVAAALDFENDVEGNQYVEWQDYNQYKEERTDDSEGLTLPEWYDFYDGRRGTGVLLGLPDVRGAKEHHYLRVAAEADHAAHAQARAEHEAALAANPPDPRPRLGYAEQDARTLEFARRFEPGKLLRLFEACQRAGKNHQIEGLEEALETLNNAHDDVIEIEAHPDWRQAVIRAAANYRRRRLLEALPVVYEQYQTRQELGIAHPPLSDYKYRFNPAKMYKARILKGRRLLGEPENFDF